MEARICYYFQKRTGFDEDGVSVSVLYSSYFKFFVSLVDALLVFVCFGLALHGKWRFTWFQNMMSCFMSNYVLFCVCARRLR